MFSKVIKQGWPVIPALIAFAIICNILWFIQDDAYISYRYVANFLNGNGLVFNIGEHVEGITNHGWTIFMIFLGSIGLPYIVLSQIIGALCGAGTIVVAYLTGLRLFGEKAYAYAALAACLVGFNLSLGYWSVAGLETGTFALAASLCLYWYLAGSRWLVAGFFWAVWLRPEGALVTGLIIIIDAIVRRRIPYVVMAHAALAFVLSLPFVIFKIGYYGSVLPNPLHAKTSWSPSDPFNFTSLLSQLQNGLEYSGIFFKDYAFFGIGFALPLLFYKKMTRPFWVVYLFVLFYTIYITLMGGDVLKVHRFFLPVFGASALLIAGSLWLIFNHTKLKTQTMIIVLALLPLLPLTLYMPYDFVTFYNTNEKQFTAKMKFQAEQLLKTDPNNFSVALPTIGIFGFTLVGHTIIDMLGLTDSTIAKYSEDPIPGMVTTWKEQKHNSKYLLTRGPDYIVFSTGIKPSAPAERALLLYPQFIESYRTRGWYYNPDSTIYRPVVLQTFKKIRPLAPPFVPTYPVAYVENYKVGLDYYMRGKWNEAIGYFNKGIAVSPKPYFPYLLYQKGFCLMSKGEHDSAMAIYNEIIATDSTVWEAHRDMYVYCRLLGLEHQAAIHQRWLEETVPWYWPRIKSTAEAELGQQKR